MVVMAFKIAESRAARQPHVIYMNAKWGHPSWHPDSRHIGEMHFTTYDSNNGSMTLNPGMATKAAKAAKAKAASEGVAFEPRVRDVSGDHPSVSPDGSLVVTDTLMTSFGGDRNEWGIVLTDVKGTGQIVLHHFDNSHGAKSWRVSHPHPVFSPDGKRIYFNVSDGEFTRLFVAEIQ